MYLLDLKARIPTYLGVFVQNISNKELENARKNEKEKMKNIPFMSYLYKNFICI